MMKTAKGGNANVVWSFTLVLSGFSELSDEVEDALFEAGCDDALPGIRSGVPYLDFDREARSCAEAVLSAIRDVSRADIGVGIERIEPDDVVGMSDIAERLGRSRESVRLLWCGRRGPGGFPPPTSRLRSTSPLWSWAEVVHWVSRNKIDPTVDLETCRDARFILLANDALRSMGGNSPSRAMFECAEITGEQLESAQRRVSRILGSLSRRPSEPEWSLLLEQTLDALAEELDVF